MFEDIFAPTKPIPPKKESKPTKRINLKPRPKELTPFEIVKQLDDVRMLAKILDLCKSKIRKEKRKARKERKAYREELSRRKH